MRTCIFNTFHTIHLLQKEENIFLVNRLVFNEKKNNEEEVQSTPESQSELEKMTRKAIISALSEVDDPNRINDDTVVNKAVATARDTLNDLVGDIFNDLEDIEKREEESQSTYLVRKRMAFTEAAGKIAKKLGLSIGAQQAILLEFGSEDKIDTYREKLEKYIEDTLRKNMKIYLHKVEDEVKKTINENTGTDKKDEKEREQKITKHFKDNFKKVVDDLQKSYMDILKDVFDKAFETFNIKDSKLQAALRDNQPRRDQLLEYYAKWLHAQKDIDDASESGTPIPISPKKEQDEAIAAMDKLLQKTQVIELIKILDLNDVYIADAPGIESSLGDHLRSVIAKYNYNQEKITELKRKLEDLTKEQEDKTNYGENITEEELKKKENQQQLVSDLEEDFRGAKNQLSHVAQFYDKDAREAFGEDKEKQVEGIRKKIRENAIQFLLDEKNGWNNDEYFRDTQAKEEAKKLLNNEEYVSDKQVLDLAERQRRWNNLDSSGRKNNPHPAVEFTKDINNKFDQIFEATGETIEQIKQTNDFFSRFISNNFPSGIPSSPEQLTPEKTNRFFDLMFSDSINSTQDNTLDKIQMQKARDLCLPYLNHPNHRDKANIPFSENESTTLGQKANELVFKLLTTSQSPKKFSANEEEQEMESMKDIESIMKQDWEEGLYKKIMSLDENQNKFNAETRKNKKLSKAEKPDNGIVRIAKGSRKFLGDMTSDWKMLNWYSLAYMCKEGFESIRRIIDLNNKEGAYAGGQIVSKYIPFIGDKLEQEFAQKLQGVENEEVSNLEGAFKQFGYDDLIEKLKNPSTTYVLKASLNVLSEKGWLMKSDLLRPETRKSINRLLGTNIKTDGIPEEMKPEEREAFLEQINKALDEKYGMGSYVNWISGSSSSRESNVQKQYKISEMMSGPEKQRNFDKWRKLIVEGNIDTLKREPIETLLGFARQEMEEGRLDCHHHLSLLQMFRIHNLIGDEHLMELQNKYANNYPVYAVMTGAKLKNSGMAEIYEEHKSTILNPDGTFNESNPFNAFFINRKKLKLYAKRKTNGFFAIASSEEERRDPSFQPVRIFASDLQNDRPANLELTDNSNVMMYGSSYNFEAFIEGPLKLNTSGNLDIKRGHELTSMLGGYFGNIFLELNAANEAETELDFQMQTQNAFLRLKAAYKFMYHMTQRKGKEIPQHLSNGLPDLDTPFERQQFIPMESRKEKDEALFYNLIRNSDLNRITQDEKAVMTTHNEFATNKGSHVKSIMREVKELCGFPVILKTADMDPEMTKYKPWEHMKKVRDLMHKHFEEVAAKKKFGYSKELAERVINDEPAEETLSLDEAKERAKSAA